MWRNSTKFVGKRTHRAPQSHPAAPFSKLSNASTYRMLILAQPLSTVCWARFCTAHPFPSLSTVEEALMSRVLFAVFFTGPALACSAVVKCSTQSLPSPHPNSQLRHSVHPALWLAYFPRYGCGACPAAVCRIPHLARHPQLTGGARTSRGGAAHLGAHPWHQP